ncbi:MAG: DUF2141 domain-containing protein [Acidobacteriota bacterium]
MRTPPKKSTGAGRRLGALLLLTALGCAGASVDGPPAVSPGELPRADPADRVFQLSLRFEALDNGRGQLVAALYGDAASFDGGGEPRLSTLIPVEGESARWTVSLPRGEYAVKAYQDLDADGELGRGDFGVPTEPYGFSNGARGTFGPPGWGEARFELTADDERTISLR